MQSGIIFVSEASSPLWTWTDDKLTKSTLMTVVGTDEALFTGDGAEFTVDINAYNAVCDGKLPASTPIGRGVLQGNSYTLWVQQNEAKDGLIEDRLVVWPSKPRVNPIRRS